MIADIFVEFGGRGISAVLGVIIGGLIAWIYGLWKRHKQRRSIFEGDARDTIVIQHHLIETVAAPGGKRVPTVLRVRCLGQASLDSVIPNGHLAAELLKRAVRVTPRHTLISMEDAEGSFLLETLTNFVCDRVANSSFSHDLYVMAPCCEPAELATHQPTTILLISTADLTLFEDWPSCRDIEVEHGTDGARILTLMELARRFRSEQDKIASLRQAGKRTKFVETMYILDLALDNRAAPIPVKKVPWGRFEEVLKQMNLE